MSRRTKERIQRRRAKRALGHIAVDLGAVQSARRNPCVDAARVTLARQSHLLDSLAEPAATSPVPSATASVLAHLSAPVVSAPTRAIVLEVRPTLRVGAGSGVPIHTRRTSARHSAQCERQAAATLAQADRVESEHGRAASIAWDAAVESGRTAWLAGDSSTLRLAESRAGEAYARAIRIAHTVGALQAESADIRRAGGTPRAWRHDPTDRSDPT